MLMTLSLLIVNFLVLIGVIFLFIKACIDLRKMKKDLEGMETRRSRFKTEENNE